MNKKIVIKLLKNQQVTQEEFLQFIVDYIEFKKKPTPTPNQLKLIMELFNMQIFQIDNALIELRNYFKLQVVTLTNNNNILKIYVYES